MGRGVVFLLIALVLGGGIWALSTRFPGTLEDEYSFASLLKLLMVLALVGPGAFYAYRGNAPRALRNVVLWLLIFVVVLALVSFREEFGAVGRRMQAELLPSVPHVAAGGAVEILRAGDGHFYVDGFVNGERVRFMVDTGASRVALSAEDARRAGVNTDALRYTVPVNTANGMTMKAAMELEYVMIGDLRVEHVKAMVAKSGQMTGSLLGMSYLNRLGGYRIEGNRLTLWQGAAQ